MRVMPKRLNSASLASQSGHDTIQVDSSGSYCSSPAKMDAVGHKYILQVLEDTGTVKTHECFDACFYTCVHILCRGSVAFSPPSKLKPGFTKAVINTVFQRHMAWKPRSSLHHKPATDSTKPGLLP